MKTLSKTLLVLTVLISGIITVYLSFKFDIKTGLLIGFLFFLTIGGFEIFWINAIQKQDEHIVKEIHKQQKSDLLQKSENNPSIR